jgi:hypothetical protein
MRRSTEQPKNFLTAPVEQTMAQADMQQIANQSRPTGAQAPASAQELDRLNRMAQGYGFNNYEEMQLFVKRRSENLRTQEDAQTGWFNRLRKGIGDAMAWHPKNTLAYTNDALEKANQK